jgi:hypothetical protein
MCSVELLFLFTIVVSYVSTEKTIKDAEYNRMRAALDSLASNYRTSVGHLNNALVDCGQLNKRPPPSICTYPRPFVG